MTVQDLTPLNIEVISMGLENNCTRATYQRDGQSLYSMRLE